MQTYPVYTFEILLFLVMPLLVLYLKGNWPLRKVIPCLVVILILWYFTYVPLHELSHAAGLYLVGGKVIGYKLIPRFWLGEFARAWITPSGITQSWQQLTMTAFPYLLDIICFIIAIFVFRRGFSRNPFLLDLFSCSYALGLQWTLYLNLLHFSLAIEMISTQYNRLSDLLQSGHLS